MPEELAEKHRLELIVNRIYDQEEALRNRNTLSVEAIRDRIDSVTADNSILKFNDFVLEADVLFLTIPIVLWVVAFNFRANIENFYAMSASFQSEYAYQSFAKDFFGYPWLTLMGRSITAINRWDAIFVYAVSYCAVLVAPAMQAFLLMFGMSGGSNLEFTSAEKIILAVCTVLTLYESVLALYSIRRFQAV